MARTTSPITIAQARALRRNATEAEQVLWSHVRDRRLAGWRFRRQHPLGEFILDFFCPALRLAAEIDGSQHGSPEARLYDERRTRFLAKREIEVVRFRNEEVISDPALVSELLARTLAARAAVLTHRSSPLPPPPDKE
jgi:adenine-specific DNA-methyltransferase